MKNTGRRNLKFILFATLALAALPVPGYAADEPETEKESLSLYFDESQLVEVATRAPKPITQIAENVTVVTADEIERMHAHTVNEVLNRVSGVFVAWYGQDFGSSSPFLFTLGTRDYHTLVLLDGVRINNASAGDPFFNFIPISIVKRIEIIKGPASSTWGSALGGVVNIITKDPADSTAPMGSVTATYGEEASRELAGEVTGAAGPASYYLNAGTMDSDGLKFDRFFDRDTAYGKFRFILPKKATLTFAGGYSDPYFRMGNFQDLWGLEGLDAYEVQRIRHFWGTFYLDLPLATRWSLHFALQRYNQHYSDDRLSQGSGISGGPMGTLLDESDWKEHTTSAEVRLNWRDEEATVNVGVETSRSSLESLYDLSVFPGLPPEWIDYAGLTGNPTLKEERHGIYANAAYTIGSFTLSPGLRYDYSSTSQDFVSPSLGMTWMVSTDTLLRATVARGFSAPYLATFLYGNNPDLKPEKIWSYQVGIETGMIAFGNLKITAFHQNVDDIWDTQVPWTNRASAHWNGIDTELRSKEFGGLSFIANFSYILEDSVIDKNGSLMDLNNDKWYDSNLIIDYNNRQFGISAQLAGHYVHMSEYLKNEFPRDNTWLWDATVGKTFIISHVQAEVFASVHNLTNASQYWDFEYANPDRWVEVGLKLSF